MLIFITIGQVWNIWQIFQNITWAKVLKWNISGHPREVEKVTWGVQTIHATLRDSPEYLRTVIRAIMTDMNYLEHSCQLTLYKIKITDTSVEYFRISRLVKMQRSDVQLSERLGCLCIMEIKLRATLKPLKHHDTMVLRGLRGPSIGSPIIPRDGSLSNCRCIFFSLVWDDTIWNDPFVFYKRTKDK